MCRPDGVQQTIVRNATGNIFVGKTQPCCLLNRAIVTGDQGVTPSLLIRLGALYAPCMRRDDKGETFFIVWPIITAETLFDAVEAFAQAQQTLSEQLGCCTQSAGQYCYVSSPDECTGRFDQLACISPCFFNV